MSRTPASHSFPVVRGSTCEEPFVYVDDTTGLPVNLAGYQARMQIRSVAGRFGLSGAETLLLECNDANGRLKVTDPANGRLDLVIDADDVALLNPSNAAKVKLAYAIELFIPAGTDPEYVIPLVAGSITVYGETTR